MKHLVVLIGLATVSCGTREVIEEQQVAITDPPPLAAGCTSKLKVPKSCPIYAAGAGEDDPMREPPLNGGLTAVCAVDDTGATYGLILGDLAPLPAGLPVLPGHHELGVYLGFDPGPLYAPVDIVLTGDNPTIEAWAAPTNINSPDCCADEHPDKRIPVTVVASGAHGILFSVGSFDSTPIQVAYLFYAPAGFGYERFYVNGPP